MSEYTSNLNLFKYNPISDAKEPFDIEKALNENWDKIDLEGSKNLKQEQITNCILEAPNGIISYSGNIITVKSGFKGLSANGRNSNNTINNIQCNLTQDVSRDISSFGNASHKFFLIKDNNTNEWYPGGRAIATQWFEQETQPSGEDWTWYNPQTAQWKSCDAGNIKDVNVIPLGKLDKISNGISSFTVDMPLELLKRTDKAEISSWGLPSEKYQELSLLASGSAEYAPAPANGYIVFHSSSPQTTCAIYLINLQENTITYALGNTGTCVAGVSLRLYVPIKKGQKFQINYTSSYQARLFFIYAQGEKND